ncbi:hypothetical protein [Flavobacterium sp.]|uniref:TolB family protein n=1 Tax=Flavobacterium sp. TaxID=239 RepID=UPI00286C881C|nr:hypothetical protein [Flavobacterium sp.]
MKNLLKTTLYVSVFALAGIFFQISCSNDSNDRSSLVTVKLIYTRQTSGNQPQIWTSNYDGTNQVQIPINFPADVAPSTMNDNRSSVKVSPDGQKIFFVGFNSTTQLTCICSCNIDGSNFQQIITPPAFETMELGGLN